MSMEVSGVSFEDSGGSVGDSVGSVQGSEGSSGHGSVGSEKNSGWSGQSQLVIWTRQWIWTKH